MKQRWLISICALALMLGAARVHAASDPRELKAREEFAAGRYQQALDIFAKLYAESLHPVYLRNIGRCYQNLGDADKAIISFRDYLRKHKTITADERTEVEGFIDEMEALKKQRAGASTATPPAAADSTPPPADPASPPKQTSSINVLTTAPEPKSGAGNGGGAAPDVLVTAPAGGARDDSSPVYTRWWFWTLIGVAAAGAGVGIFAATGGFTKTNNAGCRTGYMCQ